MCQRENLEESALETPYLLQSEGTSQESKAWWEE